jgi:hypothetical protein
MLEAMLDWAKGSEHKGRKFHVKLRSEGIDMPPLPVAAHGPGWVAVDAKDDDGGEVRLYLNERSISAACVVWLG